jgi:hypothetical protein
MGSLFDHLVGARERRNGGSGVTLWRLLTPSAAQRIAQNLTR